MFCTVQYFWYMGHTHFWSLLFFRKLAVITMADFLIVSITEISGNDWDQSHNFYKFIP